MAEERAHEPHNVDVVPGAAHPQSLEQRGRLFRPALSLDGGDVRAGDGPLRSEQVRPPSLAEEALRVEAEERVPEDVADVLSGEVLLEGEAVRQQGLLVHLAVKVGLDEVDAAVVAEGAHLGVDDDLGKVLRPGRPPPDHVLLLLYVGRVAARSEDETDAGGGVIVGPFDQGARGVVENCLGGVRTHTLTGLDPENLPLTHNFNVLGETAALPLYGRVEMLHGVRSNNTGTVEGLSPCY